MAVAQIWFSSFGGGNIPFDFPTVYHDVYRRFRSNSINLRQVIKVDTFKLRVIDTYNFL